MQFGMSGETEADVLEKLLPISGKVKNFFCEFFEKRNYGAGLEKLVIGVICVSQKGEAFFKIREKYTKSKKLLEYDIKISHKNVLSENNENFIVGMYCDAIQASIEKIKDFKISDFDFDSFKTDFNYALKTLRSRS